MAQLNITQLVVAFSIGVFLSSSSSHACAPNEALQQNLQTVLESYPNVPGAVVAAGGLGECNFAAAGYADVSKQTPMGISAVFDIGSVHKLFKWVLLEKLSEAGVLSLDDTVNDHLVEPSLPGRSLRDLALHATGLPDIGNEFYSDVFAKFQGSNLPYNYTLSDMLALMQQVSEPDSHAEFRYSSYGSLLAAKVAEIAGEKPHAILLSESILEPLNLKNTSVFGDSIPDDLPIGYGDPGKKRAEAAYGPLPVEIAQSVSSGVGGAVYSTAEDLLVFTNAMFDKDAGFLSAPTISRRVQDVATLGAERIVGAGVFQFPSFVEQDFWLHAGSGMHSHSALVAYSQSKSLGAAVLVNLNSAFIEHGHGFHLDVLNIIGAMDF